MRLHQLHLALAAWIISVAIATFPTHASACSCLYKTAEEALANEKYDAIFEGEILSSYDDEDLKPGQFRNRKIYQIAVQKVFYGDPLPTTEVITFLGSESCGYDFSQDKRHIILAKKTEKKDRPVYITSHCYYSAPFSDPERIKKLQLLLEEQGYGDQHNK